MDGFFAYKYRRVNGFPWIVENDPAKDSANADNVLSLVQSTQDMFQMQIKRSWAHPPRFRHREKQLLALKKCLHGVVCMTAYSLQEVAAHHPNNTSRASKSKLTYLRVEGKHKCTAQKKIIFVL